MLHAMVVAVQDAYLRCSDMVENESSMFSFPSSHNCAISVLVDSAWES